MVDNLFDDRKFTTDFEACGIDGVARSLSNFGHVAVFFWFVLTLTRLL